ncbi:protein-glutamate methylesterase/protein-glutamine glutaminase [Marinospirillum alkaliphilum]|uniref:Protein-glutamate methylesterase/protein-glutamine glutaminase n=1 Tax=Marinospirillum alkaliphilum DSM 21637 TaxID=1122209 RepID=A0A1K1VBU6_9GAMM|nr:chemotaxis response regulator protein-glutamate methylesterase [Marinospirillum alkaliphilum]SFX22584.1 two-component system, chemotaxis family, response regulator CheB [Marinospirillum alkaliphilum DSM 21637]
MPITVLVVDDSGFFRRRVCELLETDPRLKAIGTASNGKEAVEKTLELKPDVITMDYEMPVMDGISAVREIMARQPTPVLMFSSLTHEGARVTLDALEAGAVDYLPKNFEDISRNTEKMARVLCERVITVARSRGGVAEPVRRPMSSESSAATPAPPTSRQSVPRREPLADRIAARRDEARKNQERQQAERAAAKASLAPAVKPKANPRHFSLVMIGTSTGGPMALQTVLTRLPADFPAPIVLVQHMPSTFTGAFAERLNSLCKIRVKEAEDGDLLRPGQALLAPGGKQMMIDKRNGGCVRILPGDERLNYKPCVDVTFGSAAKVYPGKILAVVLTGMGADGREGCRLLKETQSVVWAQDEASSVIYGMPMAVAKAGLADEVINLADVADKLISDVT